MPLAGGSLLLMTARAQEARQETAAARQAHANPTGKVTPWNAMKIATGKVSGRALNANFEFEDGHWIYGVIVVTGNILKEVEIDATSGKVGDVESITPDGEAKETAQELRAAIGGKTTGSNATGSEKDEKDEKPPLR